MSYVKVAYVKRMSACRPDVTGLYSSCINEALIRYVLFVYRRDWMFLVLQPSADYVPLKGEIKVVLLDRKMYLLTY